MSKELSESTSESESIHIETCGSHNPGSVWVPLDVYLATLLVSCLTTITVPIVIKEINNIILLNI